MYLFIRSSTNPGPRVSRIINYFKSKDKKIVYLSPYRKGDIPDPEYRGLGSLGEYDYFDGSGFSSYLKYVISINWLAAKNIFKNRKDIKLVHFSDLEVVIFGSIICKIFGIKFVYNIHDNFFQRYNFSPIISQVLKYFESFFILISDKTLVPESFRKTSYPNIVQPQISVLRNYPDFDVSSDYVPFENETISLFYGGWVSPNRSIELFFDLADSLISKQYSIKFVVCGWGDTKYLEHLQEEAKCKNIKFQYLGQLSQRETIEHLKKADISIAYYSPDKVINIFAASNKIPEIIGSSTILITNNQSEIAKKIKSLNISLQFNNSVIEVVDELISLIEDNTLMESFNKRAREFYLAEYNSHQLIIDLEELFIKYV